jgi:DNA-binding transcriptional MocR family regulator
MSALKSSFSTYGETLNDKAPVSHLMASFARDFRPKIDINIGVGFVNEETLPYEAVAEATQKVLTSPNEFRSTLNYGDPAGTIQLRQAIQDMLIDDALPEDKAIIRSKKVLIGTNGATSILEGLAQSFDPGIVIMVDPVYYIYSYFLERKGYDIIGLPEDAHGMVPEMLNEVLHSERIDPKRLRFIYVVSVSNPTSTILADYRRHQIVDIVNRFCEKHGLYIPLIFDQAYTGLIHDPQVEQQGSSFRNDRNQIVFEVGTLSKILAPALRIGYIVGNPGILINMLEERNTDVGFSASPLNQQISSVLLREYLHTQRSSVLNGYHLRSVRVRKAIDAQLGPWLKEVRGGQAGFYFYLTFTSTDTHTNSDFYRYLSRNTGNPTNDGSDSDKKVRLAYIPGEFCVLKNGFLKEEGSRSLRFSYGFESVQKLEQAVQLIREALEYADQCAFNQR